jgi:hypothetical protein
MWLLHVLTHSVSVDLVATFCISHALPTPPPTFSPPPSPLSPASPASPPPPTHPPPTTTQAQAWRKPLEVIAYVRRVGGDSHSEAAEWRYDTAAWLEPLEHLTAESPPCQPPTPHTQAWRKP